MPSSPSVDPITLQPGDIALLFTDGLLEAISPRESSLAKTA